MAEIRNLRAKPPASSVSGMPAPRLLLVAPRTAFTDLAELLDAWCARGIAVTTRSYRGAPPAPGRLNELAAEFDALLLAASARRAPATVLPAPFFTARDGRRIPA